MDKSFSSDSAQAYVEARLDLIEFSLDHSLEELLTRCLDVVSEFVSSRIAFYHFVEKDQKTLSLQQWSTRTLKEFCKAEARGMKYKIAEAGVWVDCVRELKPVIHNDYKNLPHKKGMPAGHAEVIRELVVPVMREGKVVAILGVGNKADDYTQKDVEVVSYLADVTWEIIEKRRTDLELQKVAADWQTTFDAVNTAIWILDKDQKIIRANRGALELFGKTEPEMIGEYCYRIAHNTDALFTGCPIPLAKKSLRRESMELKLGSSWFEVSVDPIVRNGKYDGAAHIMSDITRRKQEQLEKDKLKARLDQAQRLEAIGRLAGGVAHDFNNMLSVIVGYTDMMLGSLESSHPFHEDLNEVRLAAGRSIDLVKQLLTFARKQVAEPKIVDLNKTVEGMLNMLKRLLGEDVELVWLPADDLGLVQIDPAQLDQIMANLCVNSRDAIDSTGRITIETATVDLDETFREGDETFKAGPHVMVAISDDGCGIETADLNKIFEPFFTTKPPGEGTGLGLATVYGIVKQNNGSVHVYSEPGEGTTIKIYLPLCHQEIDTAAKVEDIPVEQGDGKTVLLVEDEHAILRLTRVMLESLGYNVLMADTPSLAIEIAKDHEAHIDLLLTDVVMPEMNGKELRDELVALRPELKVLYMSGYTADVIVRRGRLHNGVKILQKPFSRATLARKIHGILSGNGG